MTEPKICSIVKNLDPARVMERCSGGMKDAENNMNMLKEGARRAEVLSLKQVETFTNFAEYMFLDPKAIRRKTGSSEVAETLKGFTVQDPYELCFALYYLIDTGDDAPWLIMSGSMVMGYCRHMLPWHLPEMDDCSGNGWDGWDKGIPFNRSGWLEHGYAEDSADFLHERHNDCNLAQIIYRMSRCVVPAGVHPFDEDRKHLEAEGMDEATARNVTETADLLFLSNFRGQFWLPDPLERNVNETEDAEETEKVEGNDPADEIEKLKRELSDALKQIKSYRNALAIASQNADSERAKYEYELKKLRMEHRELADLRELVFNQEAKNPERMEKVEKRYSYPYETRKRTVVFGGHDSFLRAFRPMFENVRFVDAGNVTYSPEIIRNADVVWIQKNCISHPQYWSIVKNCKRSGVQIRYFGFASAEKCAEQLITEDLR